MPNLDEGEQNEVVKRTAVSADVVHEAIRREGEGELERSSSALAWSGLAAGLSMGFTLVAEGLLRAHLPEAGWRPLVASLGYSVGFVIVVLGRQQLFTENTLTAILPLLMRRSWATLINVARLWGIVLTANLVGAFLFALAIATLPVFSSEASAAFTEIGREALANTFSTALLRGIFAGWLIALMVWLLPAAESTRVHVIILLTYLVGLGSLTHVVAGSVETFYMLVRGLTTWTTVFGHYVLPAFIGNVVGGVSLVAVLNHAQVVAGGDASDAGDAGG